MKKKRLFLILALLLFITLSACDLQEVTPPTEAVLETEPAYAALPGEDATATLSPTPAAVEITAKNAVSLAVINRSAASNIQQLRWAADSLTLLLATQNFDSTGAQAFGVTTLSVPALQPESIHSTTEERVADLAPDGKKAVMVRLDMTALTVIDLKAGNESVFTLLPDFLINNATFSSDSTSLAVSNMEAWQVTQYALSDGSEMRTLEGFETAAPVYNAGFSSAPQWMVWHARGTIQLQDLASGAMAPVLGHEDFVSAYETSSDGTMLASIALKTIDDQAFPAVLLWDPAQGTELQTLTLSEPGLCLDFSPNGSLLAVGVGSALEIWDLSTATKIVSLQGHADSITQLQFSPDGRYIATAGMDNQLHLWQVVE